MHHYLPYCNIMQLQYWNKVAPTSFRGRFVTFNDMCATSSDCYYRWLSQICDKQKKLKKKKKKVTSNRRIRTRVTQMQDQRSTD